MSTAAQTSYSINLAIGYPGLLADLGWDNRTDSFRNADIVNIDYGLAVVRGTQAYDALLPTASDQEFLGVTVRDLSLENINYNSIAFLPTQPMPVLRSGKIYVTTETDITAGDPVYYRITAADPGQQLGAFRNDADGGDAVLVTNAIFDTSGTAGNPVVLYLK